MNTFDIDQIAEMIGATPVSTIMDRLDFSDTYCYAYSEALKAGKSEDEAILAGCQAESAEADEYYDRYSNALLCAAERLFDNHNLKLVEEETGYQVAPKTCWGDALKEIVETINGVGEFHFSSVSDFLNSGPYSEEEGVISHLHWISSYPAVYGDITANSQIERFLNH